MKGTKNNKPELLAPAGNLNSALAALQSGADAVYAGISRFNAREMGENFTFDDMSRLSAYTKKLGRKLYLTLNTLIKEHELPEFADSVAKIAALSPDAVIIQDIGVAGMLREHFPEIEVHGSTQMGIHNSAGVKTASRLGLSRVILERQVTMDELREICREDMEIEVFVHGALCCSISGHCLFSSWLGGWSGNRGRCKQPCRRRFHGEEHGGKKSGFFFSTRDFYSLDMLDELTDAGVRSLKIEGRLKKPDYVRSVVSAYRMMLDAPAEDRASVLKEARSILAGSFGRKWSHGFSSAEDLETVIQPAQAGVSGRLAGTVEKTARSGFEVSVIQRLHVGDRIRIQPRSGDEGPSITITKMSSGRSPVKTATKGGRVFIHCDKTVSPRSMVYKIGDSSAESVKRPADMPLYAPPLVIELKISAAAAGLSAEVLSIGGEKAEPPLRWRLDEEIDRAEKRALSAGDLAEAFSVTRDAAFAASVHADTEEGLFMPAGRLKKSRRAFWEWLLQQPQLTETEGAAERSAEKRLADLKNALKKPAALKKQQGEAAYFNPRGGKKDRDGGGISVAELGPVVPAADEIILPFFCPEERLSELRRQIQQAVDGGIRRFRLTSLYQFEFFTGGDAVEGSENIFLTTSFPLPAANSSAAAELKRLGAGRIQLWLELDSDAFQAAAAVWPAEAEMYRRGKPFLLATRGKLEIDGKITDSRGKAFIVEKNCGSDLDFTAAGRPGGLGCVFADEVLALPKLKGCSDYYDLSRAGMKGGKESSFNYDFTLI